MATNTLPTDSRRSKSAASSASATDIAAAIIAPLASLKLTVFLLVTAIIVIFIATLQQASYDMWFVKNMHYSDWFVTIKFQDLLIEKWFPNLQNVPGSFVIPSGKLIIYALIVNLVAAHMLRFRIKAKGVKLWIGLVTAVIAGVVTWAMSFNTFAADGFQKAPPVSYAQMWLIMQVILLGLSLGCVAGMFLSESGKRIEKSILFVFAFMAASILGITLYLGKDAFIGDSGMRILWQLAQSTIAACVAWGACVLLFQRKAGIVLLHLGVVGLMANELYVTYTNKETRMQFAEGQTATTAIDLRETELVVIDQSNADVDEITVIPEQILKSGVTIEDPNLPFKVRCVEFFDNSRLERLSTPPSEDIKGIGQRWGAVKLPPIVGEGVDSASARVEIISKSGESLGEWFVSQIVWGQDFVDTILVDDKPYQIAMRFKTEYKPYSMKLLDVKAEYYTGTTTPKWFSSKVELTDHASSSTSEHEIYMNNPLRYNGETFYQANYEMAESGELSAIQIVKNQGWMIPYICCMFTVVGLAGQFGSSLLAWLKKNKAQIAIDKEPSAELVGTTKKNRNWKSAGFLIPAGVAALFGVYAFSGVSKAIKPVNTEAGMRLDRFGEIPIAYDGRVKPLDSFARNTARKLSKREFVYDGELEKQPAIRWLADTVFEADGHDKYRLFRIENLETLQLLKLDEKAIGGEPKGVRFRYSPEQLANAPEAIGALLPSVDETPFEMWTGFQKRIAKLNGQIQMVMGLNQAFNLSREISSAERLVRQGRYGKLPLSIPTDDSETPWTTVADADNAQWLKEQAILTESGTVFALYEKLLEEDPDSRLSINGFKSMMVSDQIQELFLTPQRVAQARADGANTYEEVLQKILGSVPRNALNSIRDSVDSSLRNRIASVNGGENKITIEDDSRTAKLATMFKEMGIAYRAGDAAKFNSLTDDYLVTVRDADEVKSASSKLGLEKIYNGWSPFYISMVLYLMGFVTVAFSWLFSSDQKLGKIFGRSAVAIVVIALLVQMAGLVLRVWISGRPPVTNLYSSALAVSAVFVAVMLIVELITRLGVGTAMGSIGAFAALMWAWSMSIVDGDTFSVLVAVLDTQFWLSTHVVCISIGYAINFAAGFIALAFILKTMFTPTMNKATRRMFGNIIYGVTCFALFFSFFGTVLGGLWGDDSWGRFWGWDPKENGALMIVLWGALLLHARWGGLVKERGIAIMAVLGNIVVLWSWKGVNAMGVGLHAYSASEDTTVYWILVVALIHLAVAAIALTPTKFWRSYVRDA